VAGYLAYCCGLYEIRGDRIFFMEDPTENLSCDAPLMGSPVTIGEGGQALVDGMGKVWRREPKRENENPDDALW
jgi:hypothetical protein